MFVSRMVKTEDIMLERLAIGMLGVGIVAALISYFDRTYIRISNEILKSVVYSLGPDIIVLVIGWLITGRILWFIKEDKQ